jgi:hypothetical protein
LPYADNFDSYTVGGEAQYFSDQNGAFEVAAAGGGRSGLVIRQMAPTAPINWDNTSDPYTLLGDLSWTNYTVTCDVLLEQAGYVELLGRVGTQEGFSPANINAYYLRVNSTGAWSVLKNTSGGTVTTLSSGSVSALGTNTWHTLSLGFSGSTITAKVDGTTVSTVTDSSYSSGQVGLGVSGWVNAQFDNFSVTSTQTTIPGTAYKLVSVNSGLVLDVASSSTASGALLVQSTDNGSASQHWQIVGAGNGYVNLVNVNSGLLLDVPGASTTEGTQLDQATATSGTNQQWQFMSVSGGYYNLVNRNSGMLMDVTGRSTSSGAAVIQWPSNGGANQQWQLVAVPTAGATYELVNRNSGMVMDVSGGSTSNGGLVIQWPDHQGTNQQWKLVSAGGGYFNLVNVNSGLVLDVPNQSTSEGVQLEQWTSNGGGNQQWLFTSVSGGYYTITGKQSGLLVAVSGASTAEDAEVIQWAADNGAEQQWLLSPIV